MKNLVLYIHGKGGEHWFHTAQQMRFLDDWLRACRAKLFSLDERVPPAAERNSGLRVQAGEPC